MHSTFAVTLYVSQLFQGWLGMTQCTLALALQSWQVIRLAGDAQALLQALGGQPDTQQTSFAIALQPAGRALLRPTLSRHLAESQMVHAANSKFDALTQPPLHRAAHHA